MINRIKKNGYVILIYLLILIPNGIVIFYGLESFPYTCAPMFAHYLDQDTPIYVQRFDGYVGDEKIDLTEYFGKNSVIFNRNFFCKYHGGNGTRTPYSNWIEDTEENYLNRMKVFFDYYGTYVENTHNMVLDSIHCSIQQVDKERVPKGPTITYGVYHKNTKTYETK